ncbi:hypothetical protein C0J52_17226, partial [Blattella germanica]
NTFRTEPVRDTGSGIWPPERSPYALRYISSFLMEFAVCITFLVYSSMVFSSLTFQQSVLCTKKSILSNIF